MLFTVSQAKIISALSHPVILIQAVLQVAIFQSLELKPDRMVKLSLASFFLLFLLPVALVALLKSGGWISSWEMPERRERNLPFLAVLVLAAILYLVFDALQVANPLKRFPLIGMSLIAVSLLVNLFWKISIHLVGVGATGCFFICNSLIYKGIHSWDVFLLTIITGFVISLAVALARYKLQAHNPLQLIAGWIVGFLVMAVFLA